MNFTIIIVILAVVAVSAIKENRKKLQKWAEEEAARTEEGSDPGSGMEDLRHVEEVIRQHRQRLEQIRRQAAQAEEEMMSRHTSLEEIIDEEEAFYAPKTPVQHPQVPQPTATRESAPIAPKKEEKGSQSETSAEGLSKAQKTLRDFDLEEAVIYSEILEPKFKSYE
ncbi:MAG: hypothetical protein IKZ12_06460 [Alistipes sp.]|nr:hypothetical protein [Alistipes sp.]